jgi:hypothetical protein
MVIFHSYVSLPEGKLHSISRNKNKVEDARAASPDADKVLAGWKHIDPLFTPKMDPYVWGPHSLEDVEDLRESLTQSNLTNRDLTYFLRGTHQREQTGN